MKCPVCPDTDLVMADRQGIEIDYCAKCRGVWLDRGELDKIIERSTEDARPAGRRDDSDEHRRPFRKDDSDEHRRPYPKYDDDYYRGKPYKKSKTKSIFGEIFDF
ncbi:MAG: zf-TFIIB domain-containing protein [Ilumatobacteraceae bacterium]